MAANLVAPINYHILFFGLDFYDCKGIFLKCWKSGLIDSLPILEGGIRYVLKYMDKQLFGDEKKKAFADNYIEPPFSSFSTGIGNDLFYKQIDYIQETGNYKNLAGKVRPCAPYYAELFGAKKVFRDSEKFKEWSRHHKEVPFSEYDYALASDFYAREHEAAVKLLQSGSPAILRDYEDYVQKFGAVRQLMYKQFEQSKIHDFEVFSKSVLDKIYSLQGVCV